MKNLHTNKNLHFGRKKDQLYGVIAMTLIVIARFFFDSWCFFGLLPMVILVFTQKNKRLEKAGLVAEITYGQGPHMFDLWHRPSITRLILKKN